MTELARRHRLTAVVLVDSSFDLDECREAMEAYCYEVVLVPNPHSHSGLSKRFLQLRSMASTQSFERLIVTVPAFQQALDRVLLAKAFDIVNLEFSFLGNFKLRQAPAGARLPTLVVGSHNIDYDLARQYARAGTLPRRFYAGANWRKLRREELATYRGADGVSLCSEADQRRLLEDVPGIRSLVIPNAADVEYYRPSLTKSASDSPTVVFFGLLSYFPNVDAITYFVQDIWPRVAAVHPQARLKIIGAQAPPSLLALSQQSVEVTGFVPDLRPHLSSATAVVVPLRFGGGTRLKIVEAMAMGTAIVSTSLGAEGIEAVPGRDLVIADEPAAFAHAVNDLLSNPASAARLGQSARQLAVDKYAWSSAASALEKFYHQLLDRSSSAPTSITKAV